MPHLTSSAWAASSTRSNVVASNVGLSLVREDIDMDLVPSSGYNVLGWIVDNADRTQQDVSADGRKLLESQCYNTPTSPLYGTGSVVPVLHTQGPGEDTKTCTPPSNRAATHQEHWASYTH